MADTDWNLHSKQLITPTDNDRMLVEPSDETAKAVEVGGFRNWLMSTALFNTLTTTAKNIIGAIEEVKGIADLNTTQLKDYAKDSGWINLELENGVMLDTQPQYRKIGKMVQLRGRIKNLSIINSNTTFATIPVGYRPSQGIYTKCGFSSSNSCNVGVSIDGGMYASRYSSNVSDSDVLIFNIIYFVD